MSDASLISSSNDVAYVGIGGNILLPGYADLQHLFEAVIETLDSPETRIIQRSSWYQTSAVPVSDQPDFINAVLALETQLSAERLLSFLLSKEQQFGRERSVPNAARTVDLDMLSFSGNIISSPQLHLPHPRMEYRKFVIYPLSEIAPDWVHPISGKAIGQLVAELDTVQFNDQQCRKLKD